jgi:hypothetical protein
MGYKSLPKFDTSARFLVTARLPVLNGVPMKPGEAMPPVPVEPGAARVYLRLLRQLYELRRITMVDQPAVASVKTKPAGTVGKGDTKWRSKS